MNALLFVALLLFQSDGDVDSLFEIGKAQVKSKRESIEKQLKENETKLKHFVRVYANQEQDKPIEFDTDDNGKPCVRVRFRKDAESEKKKIQEAVNEQKKELKSMSSWIRKLDKPLFDSFDGDVAMFYVRNADKRTRAGSGAVSAQAGSAEAYGASMASEYENKKTTIDFIDTFERNGMRAMRYGIYTVMWSKDEPNPSLDRLAKIESRKDNVFVIKFFSDAESQAIIEACEKKAKEDGIARK